ncbi:MAG: type II toxin-antitoxin system RelE/ParE family toxin [Bacteroidales bacterium]
MKAEEKQYEIIISPEAEQELNISKEFYESKQAGLGKRFVKEVDNTINRIIENPVQFPKIKQKQVRKANVNRFPFGIYFAVKDSIINILAVFHFSRNPKKIKKRLK